MYLDVLTGRSGSEPLNDSEYSSFLNKKSKKKFVKAV